MLQSDAGIYRSVNPSNLSDVIGEFQLAGAEQRRPRSSMLAPHSRNGRGATPSNAPMHSIGSVPRLLRARTNSVRYWPGKRERPELKPSLRQRELETFSNFLPVRLSRAGGELIPSVRTGVTVEVTREPLGVVAAITPWNYPLAIPAWKVAPALAFGNCVIFKPAELVPACALALAEIIDRAALPEGVFQTLVGEGRIVGDLLVRSPGIDGITFTGSVEIGKSVAATATDRLANVQLEMGGKNPLVVLDDANLDVAVDCAIQGAYYSTGQRCTASSRLIVTEAIHDRFVDAMVDRMERLCVGDALDPKSDIGPVVDERQLAKNLEYLEIARKEHAELAFGGELLQENGYFYRPGHWMETSNDMRINRDEIFGPTASVIRVRDYEEAIATANETPFGLVAGICTASLEHATQFKRDAQAGMVMINLPTAGVDYHVPFGGRKQSSFGPREQGGSAREFYTIGKTTYIAAR